MDVRLVVEKNGRKRHTFQMSSQEMILGRGEDCELRIPSAAVSRDHCRVTWSDDGYVTVEDLNSRNGTVLNGTPVEGLEIARPGDRLEVGPVTFVIEYELTQEALERIESAQGGEAPLELLVELADDAEGSKEIPELLTLEEGKKEEEDEEFLLPLDEDEPEEEKWEEFDFDKSGSLELQEEEFRDFLSQLDDEE